MNPNPPKSWFKLDDRPHERMLTDQMRGLRPLLDEVRNARARGRPLTILDVGCAEGLIGMELAKAGAAEVHGVEIVAQRVKDANRLRGSLPCSYELGDASRYQPRKAYDVVLCLSILHKLPNPTDALLRLVGTVADKLVVIRLPPGRGPVIIDPRSNNVPHDLGAVLAKLRFNLETETEGHLGEWIGTWRTMQ